MVSFRLLAIFYVFALLASAMATFGPIGAGSALVILCLWIYAWGCRAQLLTIVAFVIVAVLLDVIFTLSFIGLEPVSVSSREKLCRYNLRQLQLALIAYETRHGRLPPPYVADATGKPMHSWRVLLLPYLEEDVLYSKYKFDEPWNGPNNRKLAAHIPEVFRCPSNTRSRRAEEIHTSYFAIVGEETAWPVSTSRRTGQFKDGASSTITIIEASGLDVNWMEPRDVNLDEAVELMSRTPRSGHDYFADDVLFLTHAESSFRNVAYADGHVEWIGQPKDAKLARGMFTIAGGETIPATWDQVDDEPRYSTVIQWDKVCCVTLFAILSLLPALWLRMQRLSQDNVEGIERIELIPISPSTDRPID